MTDVKEPPVKAQITDKDNRPTPLWAHWFQNIFKAISDSEASAGVGTHATSDGTSHSVVVSNQSHANSNAIHLTAVQKDDLTDGGDTTLHKHLHSNLNGITPDDHHNQLHSTSHKAGGFDDFLSAPGIIGGITPATNVFAGEINLTPKASSSGPEGTMFYCETDNSVYVGVE